MAESKKRVIKSLDTLSPDLKELMRKQYPTGYEKSITRIVNAKKEPIFVFPLEAEEAIYLVKIPTTRNSEGDYDVESGVKQEFDEEDDVSSTPDDSDGTDFDSEADGKEPSYEPDFDK